MIKIMLTVRNRLAITRKCVQAIKKHSVLPHEIYVYDNLTNYRVEEHFNYFYKLYKKKLITQVTFNTKESTFNAFSKAAACNQFGRLHEEDPNKSDVDFLVFLDNDIILSPSWDKIFLKAWRDVKEYKMDNVKVVAQHPGGIKQGTKMEKTFAGRKAVLGRLGGSGLWTVKNDFFTDVGYLKIKSLVGQNKRHDQEYWKKMSKASGGKPYILGIKEVLGIHCGSMAGSVCNVLTRNNKQGNKLDLIKFEEAEKKIDNMSFDEFYTFIKNTIGTKGW